MGQILSVTMVNNDTKEEVLLRMKGSRCHFKKLFRYKNYEIQLRLDYNGKPNEAPTLDADINDITTGKLIKKGPWYHTEAKHDVAANTYIYTFKFDDLIVRFSTITSAATDRPFSITVGKP